MQADSFFEAEKEVHVVDGLSARPFEEIVYHRDDKEFTFMLTRIDEAFVCVDHLFQIRTFFGEEGKGVIVIVIFIKTSDFFFVYFTVEVNGGKDTA